MIQYGVLPVGKSERLSRRRLAKLTAATCLALSGNAMFGAVAGARAAEAGDDCGEKRREDRRADHRGHRLRRRRR